MLDAPLLSREMTLKATRTNASLTYNKLLSSMSEKKCQNALTVTWRENIPVESKLRVLLQRWDVTISHEKVNVIIRQQEQKAKKVGYYHEKIACCDSTMFCLYYCRKKG